MVRTAVPALAVAVVFVLFTTCTPLDLVDPDPRAPGASARIYVTEGTGLNIDIDVGLTAGIDATGRANNVADNRLIVNGTAIDPVEHVSPDLYSYRATISSPPETASASLELLLPRVEGLPGDQVQAQLPLLRRTGAMNLTSMEQPHGLTLEYAWNGMPARTQWMLELKSSCTDGSRAVATFTGPGDPPSPIVLPWQLLSTVLPSRFEACLRIDLLSTAQDGQYIATVGFSSGTSWIIDAQ